MSDQLVKEFGSLLSAQILPSEVERRDCPDTLFPVILLLRLLVGDHLSILYKTMWEADDGNTHYTDIFVYDAGSQYHKASYRKIASAHVDTAISVSWEAEGKDVWGEATYQSSYGVIRWLSIDTALGSTVADAKDAVLALLQLAASTCDKYDLLAEAGEEGVISLGLRSYKAEDSELINVGRLHWSTVQSRCNRFYENRGDCAFQLM